MSKVLQFFYFLCYGLAALAIAFMAPKIFPETPHSVAILAGAVVFLCGALMHEIASRCYYASLDRRRLALLHRAYQEASDELDRLATEVQRLKRDKVYFAESETDVEPAPEIEPEPEWAPPAATRPAPAARAEPAPAPAPPTPKPPVEPPARSRAEPMPAMPSDAGAVASEVKVLHALIQRLYAPPDRGRAGAGLGVGGKTTVVSGSLIEREILSSVRDSLRHSQVELHLAPVVTLPQRKQRHFDCTLRIALERGEVLAPVQYESIIRDNGLTLAVDDMLLFRTVQLVGKSQKSEPGGYYFCRVSPGSLSDRAFFGDFLAYLRDADDLTSCLAFEFREEDLIDLDDAAANVVGSLVELGFHLCIEGLRNFDVDAGQLAEGGVRFVKVDAGMLMPAITGETEALRLRRLKSALNAAGIELIVANIANEQLLVELLDFDIEFGQGPLFGEGRKVRGAQTPPAEGKRERL
jgi:cyclic-di-GMP phosphodiesterase, flagellum assembly factor TipF